MSNNLRPGQKGERLPGGIVVVRLSKGVFDLASAHASQFDLSTADKESDLQALSVWAIELTPVEKARDLMGDKRADYRAALHLNVNDVRDLQLSDDSPIKPLDVVWEPLNQPGAEGHSGIIGLQRPKEAPRDKYKTLRARLAAIATVQILYD